MTLILGLDCADGLLLASDSQNTFNTSGQPLRGMVEKIYCQWSNLAWGAAGHGGIIQRVQQELRKKFPNENAFASMHPNDVRRSIAELVSKTVRPLAENQYLQLPNNRSWETSFLFVGTTRGGPFLLEIGIDLSDTDHLADDYVAIGTGAIFAYHALASLSHLAAGSRTIEEAKVIAYRVMDDAISVAATLLGPPIQMIEVSKQQGAPGVAHKLSDDELRILAESVLAWKELESVVLSESLSSTSSSGSD